MISFLTSHYSWFVEGLLLPAADPMIEHQDGIAADQGGEGRQLNFVTIIIAGEVFKTLKVCGLYELIQDLSSA